MQRGDYRSRAIFEPVGKRRVEAIRLDRRPCYGAAPTIFTAHATQQTATYVLTYCNMRTLYLRNVPDEVVERLERLAARDATSVGAVAVRELAEASRRADNPALLGALPNHDVDTATLLDDLGAERAHR